MGLSDGSVATLTTPPPKLHLRETKDPDPMHHIIKPVTHGDDRAGNDGLNPDN